MRNTALGAGITVALVPLAAANGGYFPTSWGWAVLGYAWVALLALLMTRTFVLAAYDLSLLGGLAALSAWIWLSTVWSRDLPATVIEGERSLVYVAGVAALLLVVRGRTAELLGGALGAVVLICLYALGTRLLPDRVGTFDSATGYRLATPIGYWNSLGLFAAIGILLALGLAARASSVFARTVAGASLAPLAVTLYFTFSRGAWVALFTALVFLVAVDPRRLQLLVVALGAAPASAAAVWLAWHAPALTTQGVPIARAQHAGHRFALELLALAAAGALAAGVAAAVEWRWSPPRPLRRGFAVVAAAAALAGVGAVWVGWGSPPALVERGWHGFVEPPTHTGPNLNQHLLQLSGTRRIVTWRSALREFHAAPIVGTGAGSFETWWLADRPGPDQVRDAHSLYLETLGELGIVGLALLALVLLVPLVAAVSERRRPLVPAAGAAFVAWMIHVAADWDWEVGAVTLLALMCAAACTTTADPSRHRSPRLRIVLATAAVCAAGFALVMLVGNHAGAAASAALGRGNLAAAQSAARRAARWAPWSAEPWLIRGQIETLAGDHASARASFRRALDREPRSYLAWYGLASVEHGAARRAAAAEVVTLDPFSEEAREMRKVLARSAGSSGNGSP